eukprot:403337027
MNNQENDGFQANSYQSDTIIQNNAQTHDRVHIWKFLDKLQLELLEKHYNQQEYIQERAVNIGDSLVNIQDGTNDEISNNHEELKISISIGEQDYYVGINNADNQSSYVFDQGQVLLDTSLDDQSSFTTEVMSLSEYNDIDDDDNWENHSQNSVIEAEHQEILLRLTVPSAPDENLLPVINSYTSQVFQINANSNETCSICIADFESNCLVKILKCSHTFHSNCIDEWLKIKLQCPLYKQTVSENCS